MRGSASDYLNPDLSINRVYHAQVFKMKKLSNSIEITEKSQVVEILPQNISIKAVDKVLNEGTSSTIITKGLVIKKKKNLAVVIKESLSKHPKNLTRTAYEREMIPHQIASCLANEFNQELSRIQVGNSRLAIIEFTVCSLGQVLDHPGCPYFILEDNIDGLWEKYNNNMGFVEANPTQNNVDHSIVQAFCHFTHQKTLGKLMVVNCKGTFKKDQMKFVLTGPVVISLDLLEYPRTNMGSLGMENFFKSHICNAHCISLNLRSGNKSNYVV
jgi:hypothetical protein